MNVTTPDGERYEVRRRWLSWYYDGLPPCNVLSEVQDAVALVVLPFVLVARTVFRRPWPIEVRQGEQARWEHVRGWRASGRRVDEICAGLQGEGQRTPVSPGRPRGASPRREAPPAP